MLKRPETRRSFNRPVKGGILKKIQSLAGRHNGRPFNDQGGTKIALGAEIIYIIKFCSIHIFVFKHI